MPPFRRIVLLLLVSLFSASGATCPRRTPPVNAPPAFQTPPTLADVLRVVNSQSDPIYQLQTDNARLIFPGTPGLRTSIAIQRPRSFRLRAQFIGMGEVLDMGSNDQLFWALVDAPSVTTGMPRAVYFAHHDQPLSPEAQQVLPIKPDALVEAFGLIHFDANHEHQGPWQHGTDQLEFRSRIPGPEGEQGRITVVHATYGWITQQHLYGVEGQWVASAIASQHRYYPEAGISLPHRIEVRLPPPSSSFHLEIESYAINQLRADPGQLFSMPTHHDHPQIDLAAPAALPPLAPQPSAGPPPPAASAPDHPATGHRPRYRGYTAEWR